MKETKELITAVVGLVVRTVKNLGDDGKLSWTESIGYLQELGAVKDAISGIQLVPGEIINLTADEQAQIREQIYMGLIAAGVTHRMGDIIDRAMELSGQLVGFALFVKNAPPTAEAV